MAIVETTGLSKRYPRPENKAEFFHAVDGLSLSIDAGEIYGILGPNGAGKTTTLEMLEGLTDIDGGEAFIDGINVRRLYATRDTLLLGNHPVLWRDESLASLMVMRCIDLQLAMLLQLLQ